MSHRFLSPQGHSSFITHVDWSKDSCYLITNSGDYEILFCASSVMSPHLMLNLGSFNNTTLSGEAPNGRHVTNMDAVRDVEWATSTCTLSFTTFGRWILKRLFPFSSRAASTSPFFQQNFLDKCFSSFLRNLARWSRRYRHQCRVQVTWRVPAGLRWWLWQSALVLLPLLSAKGQSCSLTPRLRRSVSEFLSFSQPLQTRWPFPHPELSRGAALTKAGNTTSTCIKWIISVRCLFCTARLLFNKEKCWVQTANWSLTQLVAQTGWISSSQMFGWELQGILLRNPAHLRTFCG